MRLIRSFNFCIKQALPLMVLGTLVACGGGSSTSQPEPAPPAPQPPAPDSLAPTAEVVFPWGKSRTNSKTIMVTGNAFDDGGVESVKVNGVEAQLEHNEAQNTTHWSASVPVTSDIVIETTDSAGNHDSQAAKVTLLYDDTLVNFAVDNINHRLFGKKHGSNVAVLMDLQSEQYEKVALSNGVSFQHIVYAEKEGVFIQADSLFDVLSVRAVDPDTGNVTLLDSYFTPRVALDWSFTSLSNISYSSDENAVYFNLSMFSRHPDENHADTSSLSHIVRYDLNNQQMNVVLDGYSATPGYIYTDTLVATGSRLIVAHSNYLGNYHYRSTGLQGLSFDGTELTQITSESFLPPFRATLDYDDSNLLWGVDFEDVTKIDLTTGKVSVVSSHADQSDLFFSQMTSAEVDIANNRLLVGDYDLDMVIAVDMEDGTRTRFMHNGVGQGRTMIYPNRMVLDEINGKVYAADDGNNAPEAVIEIDLSTGNRREVGQINRQYNVWIEDIVLDQSAQRLYVIFGSEILSVDIASGDTQVLTTVLTGGRGMTRYLMSAVLDKDNNRLLVVDTANYELLAVDVSSGQTTVISSEPGGVGSGESLGSVNSIVLDRENNHAIAVGSYARSTGNEDEFVNLRALFTIDLETGDRERWSDVCSDHEAFTTEDTYTIGPLIMDSQNANLYMVTNSMLVYDRESGECNEYRTEGNLRIVDAVKTSKEQWLTLGESALHQVDFQQGQSVIISK